MAGGDDSPGNREATLHGRVQSDYVVALYDIFHVVKTGKAGVDVPKIYMSMECGGPSLWALAESGHRFREEEIVQIVRDVLRGMMDCHTVGVLARDVRMRNIIKVDDKYKIIDFGAAIDVNDTATMEMWCITDLEHGRRQCFQEVVELAEDLFSFSDTPPSAAAKEFMQLTAGSDEVNALARLQQHSFLA
jgi:serine/threonine protein kinase